MAAKKGGAPLKRGTVKQHTTQRLEVNDKAWLETKAKASGISTPDLIHALVEVARLPGSDAEKLAALSSQLVFFQTEVHRLAKGLGGTMERLRDAQEKNFLLAQRLRAQHGAFIALPDAVQRQLPANFLAKNRRVFEENVIKEDERVVVF